MSLFICHWTCISLMLLVSVTAPRHFCVHCKWCPPSRAECWSLRHQVARSGVLCCACLKVAHTALSTVLTKVCSSVSIVSRNILCDLLLMNKWLTLCFDALQETYSHCWRHMTGTGGCCLPQLCPGNGAGPSQLKPGMVALLWWPLSPS